MSDDDDWYDFNESEFAPELQGTLSKWTNYIHGWQNRYVALKEGNLIYYKSEVEADFGCRGSISVDKATVRPHDLDQVRFDVFAVDCVWYLKATTIEVRQHWIDSIEAYTKFILESTSVDKTTITNFFPPKIKSECSKWHFFDESFARRFMTDVLS